MRAFTRHASVFALRGGEAGARYALSCALALSLAVEGVGQIYVALAIIGLAAALARFGLDAVVVRRVSVAMATEDLVRARGLALHALRQATLLGLSLAALLAVAAPWLLPGYPQVLIALAGGIAALAVLGMMGSLLTALGRPAAGLLVGSVLWPALAALAVLLGPADPSWVGWAMVLAMLLATGLGTVLLWRFLVVRGQPIQWPAWQPLLSQSWPFFGVEMVHLLLQNLPLIALGLLASDREAGLFGLAIRVSMLVTVLTTAVAAPRLARCHATSDRAGLRRALHEASRAVCLLGLPLSLGLMAFPTTVLGLFGEDFRAAAPVLVVAMLGQVANLLFSQGYTLLAMTGRQHVLLRIALLSLTTMLVALALLMPPLGALGAAIAVALSWVVMGLGQAVAAWRGQGMNLLEAFLPAHRWPAARSAAP